MIEKRDEYELRNLNELEDVQTALEKLSHDLPAEKMERVTNFNHTYLVITRRVRNELKKESFDYPDFLNTFDTVFANYYFVALKGYLTDDEIPTSWNIAFTTSSEKKVSNFISMALGVNAHVNNDIAQVLRDCNAHDKHRRDYNRINAIIAASVDEVINDLKDDETLLEPKNKLLRHVYKVVIIILIRRWRYSAWQSFKSLQSGKKNISAIEKNAATKANFLARLPL